MQEQPTARPTGIAIPRVPSVPSLSLGSIGWVCRAGAQLQQQQLKLWLTLSTGSLAGATAAPPSPAAHTEPCRPPSALSAPGLPRSCTAECSCCPSLHPMSGITGNGDESPAARSGWSPGTTGLVISHSGNTTDPTQSPAHPLRQLSPCLAQKVTHCHHITNQPEITTRLG